MGASEYETWLRNEVKPAIPAATWNKFVATARTVDALVSPGRLPGSQSWNEAVTIACQNKTALGVKYGEVVGLGTPIQDPTKNNGQYYATPVLRGVLPVEATHVDRFGVAVRGGGQDSSIVVAFRGICWARVNVLDAGHKTCGVKTGETSYLESGKSGASIFWAEKQDDVGSETGEQWAIVHINGASANPGALATGIVVTADVPKATYNQTTGELTPGTSVSARVKPLVSDPPGGVPTKLIEEQSGGSDLELEVLNYTQSTIYHDAHPSRQVFGFRQTFGGVEYFVITGNLRRSAINGDAAAAVSTFSGTFTVNNIEVISGSGPTETNGTASTSVTVDNTFGFAIDSGGRVRCEQKDDGTWECVQAECPV